MFVDNFLQAISGIVPSYLNLSQSTLDSLSQFGITGKAEAGTFKVASEGRGVPELWVKMTLGPSAYWQSFLCSGLQLPTPTWPAQHCVTS